MGKNYQRSWNQELVNAMKIQNIEAFKVVIPTSVKYAEAGGTYTSFVRSLVVRLTTDAGQVGVGDVHESVPGYTSETLDTMYEVVTKTYGPQLKGMDLESVELLHNKMIDSRRGNNFARCAVEMAAYDALARSRKISICTMLGGPVRNELQLVGGIGIDDLDVVVKRAVSMVSSGYRTIKLKIGTSNIKEDLLRVKEVRSAVGDEIMIRVDANAGYLLPDAIRVVRGIADLGVEHFEQPVARENVAGMAYLMRMGAVSILADESVHDAYDAIRIITEGAADGIKIKISKVGGFVEARKIIDIAEAAGVKLIIGNGICSSIEAAAELQLACAYSHVYPVAEMVGPAKLSSDLAKVPFNLDQGSIKLGTGAGLGVELSEEMLKKLQIY